MKFKVGDKIRAIDNVYGHTCKDYGWTGTVTELRGEVFDAKTISGEHSDREERYYSLNEKHFELIPSTKLTREELLSMPSGTRITTDLDSKYNIFTKADDEFISDDGTCIDGYDINDDLTLDDDDYGTKIIKIEKPAEYETVYDRSTEVKEMTIADIEKALGHLVKIVKEAE